MPQMFQVLRCYKCLVFQVHQTKKSNKWGCKLCGEKQSIKRHYGIGTAKDCRLHVQKLNGMRGEIDEHKCGQMQMDVQSDAKRDSKKFENPVQELQLLQDSKWSNYIEEPEPLQEFIEPMHLGNSEVVLEIPKKQRIQFKKYSRDNYTKSTYITDYTIKDNHMDRPIKNGSPSDLQIPDVAIPECNISIKPLEDNALSTQTTSKSLSVNQYGLKEISKPIKTFVTPVINKNSKWAQFAEEEEPDIAPTPDLVVSNTAPMFSLCDDTELDNVLDI